MRANSPGMDKSHTNAKNSPSTSQATVAQHLLLSLLLALRPRQWAKNGLLFAGLLFTLGEPQPPHALGRACLAFAIFCLLSGCGYLINDLRDREMDRLHPKKRFRPLASGALSVPAAIGFVAVGLSASLFLAGWILGFSFLMVALAYIATTVSYSLYLKNVVIVDVMTVAAGFVLRAVAGAVALPVKASEWLLLCTFLLALFIALMKRRAELVALGEATATRPILAEYNMGFLDQTGTLVATACLIAYLLYTVISPTGQAHPGLMATCPFVLYGLLRYLHLTHRQNLGEAPEMVLAHDRPMQVNLALWIAGTAFAMLWSSR